MDEADLYALVIPTDISLQKAKDHMLTQLDLLPLRWEGNGEWSEGVEHKENLETSHCRRKFPDHHHLPNHLEMTSVPLHVKHMFLWE